MASSARATESCIVLRSKRWGIGIVQAIAMMHVKNGARAGLELRDARLVDSLGGLLSHDTSGVAVYGVLRSKGQNLPRTWREVAVRITTTTSSCK